MMSNSQALPAFWGQETQAPIASPEKRQPHDPVGMWYTARKQAGIDDRMWFGFFEQGRSTPQWHTCSHRFSDGIGGLALLLRERYDHDCGPLPKGKDRQAPHWKEVWRLRPPVVAPQGRMRWRHLDAGLSDCASHVPVTVLLNVMQTRGIEQQAKEAGVSSTVWLLWTADRALRATLAQADSVNSWVFPVNLRGAVQGEDEFTNHCSGFGVQLSDVEEPLDVKQQIADRFARLEHWRQWFFLTLGRWIGQRGVNWLFRFAQGRPGRHAGSYSNLGEWNTPGIDGITCSAPGSPAYPVAVSTVLCNGRRALACRLHPVIGGNPGRAIEFLRHWRKFSLSPINHSPVNISPTHLNPMD